MRFRANTIIMLDLALCISFHLSAQNSSDPYPGMEFTKEQLKQHMAYRNKLPLVLVDGSQVTALASPTYLNLLSYFPHDQTAWNQGDCGNCWVYGSTAAVSIMNGVQGRQGPLSVQFFNSAYNNGTGSGFACCPGFVENFINFYSGVGYFIPWSNNNASFMDLHTSCGNSTLQPLSGISTAASWPFYKITEGRIGTVVPGQPVSVSISAIKSVLNQNIPIVFSFYASSSGWSSFKSWWNTGTENSICTNFDSFKGSDFGHTVALVGYDESDSTWIFLNSWGVTSLRPNGTFKLPQTLSYNTSPTYEFDAFTVSWYNTNVTIPTPSTDQSIGTGTTVTFTGNCSNSGSQPLQYVWDFGDGNSISGSSPTATHTFYTSGSTVTRKVILTINSMANPMNPTLLGKGLRNITVHP